MNLISNIPLVESLLKNTDSWIINKVPEKKNTSLAPKDQSIFF